MPSMLVVIAGPDQGRAFTLVEGKPLIVGRGGDADFLLRDPRASRRHCQLDVQAGSWSATDLGSSAGTLVNGKAAQREILKPGDLIQIGDSKLRLFLDLEPGEQTIGPPTRPAAVEAANEAIGDLAGKTIAHFRLDSLIARGDTGAVYLAEDLQDGRAVALKVLQPEFANDDERVQRFIRAMKTLLPVKHPHIVRIRGAGKNRPYCWLAMEYVPGESLVHVIERIGAAGMLDWRTALRVAVHVSRALICAAEHGFVHRNITPSNILVRDHDKCTKLAGLMLAKATEGELAQDVTAPGRLVGDLAFMSPERTRGVGTDVDLRSDVYSLGATLYALLTGRPPFVSPSLPEMILKIRDAEPERPKKFQLAVPDLFEGVVLRMLAKRPEDRYQTPEDLETELMRVAKFQGMTF